MLPVVSMSVEKNQNYTPIHPALLMPIFWSIIFLIYALGPIYLTPAISITTFIFIIGHICLFVLGAIVLSNFTFFSSTVPFPLTRCIHIRTIIQSCVVFFSYW